MRKSFTLIELIVVIGIIALLSGLGASAYNGFQQAARDQRRKNDLETITNALNAYYAVNGRFPRAGSYAYGTQWRYVWSYPAKKDWIPALVPDYIEELPVDPINNGSPPWSNNDTFYSYSYGNVSSDGQQYDLTARLENTNDEDRCGLKDYQLFWNPQSWCRGEPGAPGYPFGGNYPNQIYEFSPNSLP